MEVLIGLLIGFAIGSTGVGGGAFTAPALVLILRFPPRAAIATALVFAAVVKIGAAGIYLWRKQVNFRVLGYLLAGGIPGAVLGAVLLAEFATGKPGDRLVAVVGALIMISAGSSLFRGTKLKPQAHPQLMLVPFLSLPIGVETGFSSAGAGALGSVLLLSLTNLAPATVVGTDLWFGLAVSATGAAVHAFGGNCNWASLAVLLPSGLVGAILGARFAQVMPSQMLRRALLLWATLVGFLLIYKSLSTGINLASTL